MKACLPTNQCTVPENTKLLPVIHDLIQWYRTKELHKNRDDDSLEMKQFLCQRGKLVMRNGIMYCKNDTKESECPDWNTMQLVLLTTLRLQALKGCHDDLGHLAIERTLDLLRDPFYWPQMTEDVTRHIWDCERCLQFKAPPYKAPLENVTATYPMELVYMDYLTIEATEGRKRYPHFSYNWPFHKICPSYHH